jgi:hypothetical protein
MVVDSPSARSSCELGVLRGREKFVALTGEFCEFVDHDCSSGHVDSESQSFGGEDNTDQPFDETLLDSLFEWRNQSGVMTRNPTLE